MNSVSSHLQAVNRRSWAACRSWRRRLAPSLKLEHRRRHRTSPLVMAALSLPRRSLIGHSRTMQCSHRMFLWRRCRPSSSCCTTRTSSTTRTCSSSGTRRSVRRRPAPGCSSAASRLYLGWTPGHEVVAYVFDRAQLEPTSRAEVRRLLPLGLPARDQPFPLERSHRRRHTHPTHPQRLCPGLFRVTPRLALLLRRQRRRRRLLSLSLLLSPLIHDPVVLLYLCPCSPHR